MAERKRINLIFRYNENWMGGTYYIINIIKAINLLEDESKPFLMILHAKGTPLNGIADVKYPYLAYKEVELKTSLIKRVVNKMLYFVNGKRLFRSKLPSDLRSNVYPLYQDFQTSSLNNAYYWIPDFQERYYPDFFSKRNVRARNNANQYVLETNGKIVFSSRNALEDFNKFYPTNKNQKSVLNFTSFIDDAYREIELEPLLARFNIKEPYFIVPNQFWKHKNHMTVLKAIALLKGNLPHFQVVFTGKLYDYRDPSYGERLLKFVSDNKLDDFVSFLGFIDRGEQLRLMTGSMAIIQPSLFEGWSTVVEDAKAINKFILVSAIPLHLEQIKQNCMFFDPEDAKDLADKMKSVRQQAPTLTELNYNDLQVKFARDFIALFNDN